MVKALFTLLIAAATILPIHAWTFAVAFTTAGYNGDFSTSVSLSLTMSGSDRILVCNVSVYNPLGTITGVTYDSVAMSEVSGSPLPLLLSSYSTSVWYLVAPNTGTHNAVATTNTTTIIDMICAQYTGVDQSTPLGTWAEASGSGSSPQTATVNISSASGEVVVDVVRSDAAGATAGSGQTERNNQIAMGISDEAGASTTTMSWDLTRAQPIEWVIGGISLKPVGGGGATGVVPAIINSPLRCCEFLLSPWSLH